MGYNIASNAGMNPNQFCKIRNGCFANDVLHDSYTSSSFTASSSSSDSSSSNNNNNNGAPTNPFFRKIMASTRISELLGVEPVFAEKQSLLQQQQQQQRSNTISSPY